MQTASSPLRVLHLEDSLPDAELIHERLGAEGIEVQVTHVTGREPFEAAVTAGEFDIVLCDYNIPGYEGLAAMDLVRRRQPLIPVLIISGSLGEDEAVRCLQLGATDYILKQRLSRLGLAIRRALGEAEEQRRRRRTEDALRVSEERFRLLVENSSDLVCETSPEGRFLYLSPNVRTLLGHDPAELIGTSVFDLLHPDDVPAVRAKFGQPEMRAQPRCRHLDGGYRWLEITGRVFTTAGGEQRAGFIARDVTERRLLEEELRQSQKMESIGQLAGGVAHDFNNILTVILGQASLAGYEPGLTPQIRESLAEITEAAERAAALTRQLLTFSRKQIMQPRDLDLNSVVNEMTRMLRRTLGDDITLVVNLEPGIPHIHADQAMMQQILLNLAVNGRDAMAGGGRAATAGGGRLEITTSATIITRAQARTNPEAIPGPAVCLTVSDTGSGIPKEIIPRIFEPFFTTKEVGKGTGLGLASVHGIVKQHRGWIRLTSEIGLGTVFHITLPAHTGEIGQAARVLPDSCRFLGSETVLLVDDDPAVRLTGTILLKHLGYTVIEANSGTHALDVAAQCGKKIDLLFTDMVMPGGIGGKELAEILRARIPGLRVLYSSGYSLDLAGKGILGGDDAFFLQKPYATQTFAKAVRDCLQGEGAG